MQEGPIVHDFLGGDLVVIYVTYKPDSDGTPPDPADDEFYVHFSGTSMYVYEYAIDMARAVASHRPSFWQLVVRSGTIPGVIAIFITITICYMALAGTSEKIPQVLGAALTTILGFYFGSRVAQK